MASSSRPSESARVLAAAGIPMRAAGAPDAVDFGRYLVTAPSVVACPRTVDELAAAMAALFAAGVPYVLRGAAHSSGGQVLTASVTIETRGVAGVGTRTADWIDVLGGTTWLAVAAALRPSHRPVTLTDNLVTTVGGTLAVGGVGDRALHAGLQIASVLEAEWLAPDGTRRVVTPGDPALGLLLGGRGQLGAFGRVRLATLTRPLLLAGHLAAWDSLPAFAAAMRQIERERSYEVVRATAFWRRDGSLAVRAVLASFVEANAPVPALADRRYRALHATTGAVIPPGDRHLVAAQPRTWNYVCPALEVALPCDDGELGGVRDVLEAVAAAGLRPHVPDGIALAVTRVIAGLPLAPTPGREQCCFVAIRPQLASAAAAPPVVAALRAIGDAVLARGGRIYLMGIESERADFLERQFGAALAGFRAHKDALDPARLCNRWKL